MNQHIHMQTHCAGHTISMRSWSMRVLEYCKCLIINMLPPPPLWAALYADNQRVSILSSHNQFITGFALFDFRKGKGLHCGYKNPRSMFCALIFILFSDLYTKQKYRWDEAENPFKE